jgi:hypothetical protein
MNCDADLVGQWYLRRDLREIFQVTGYDERSGTVEIQTFDGGLDEIDEETWQSLRLTPVDPPKDWTGPLDSMEAEGAEDRMQASEGYEFMDRNVDPEAWPEVTAEDGLDWESWQQESEDVYPGRLSLLSSATEVFDASHQIDRGRSSHPPSMAHKERAVGELAAAKRWSALKSDSRSPLAPAAYRGRADHAARRD